MLIAGSGKRSKITTARTAHEITRSQSIGKISEPRSVRKRPIAALIACTSTLHIVIATAPPEVRHGPTRTNLRIRPKSLRATNPIGGAADRPQQQRDVLVGRWRHAVLPQRRTAFNSLNESRSDGRSMRLFNIINSTLSRTPPSEKSPGYKPGTSTRWPVGPVAVVSR